MEQLTEEMAIQLARMYGNDGDPQTLVDLIKGLISASSKINEMQPSARGWLTDLSSDETVEWRRAKKGECWWNELDNDWVLAKCDQFIGPYHWVIVSTKPVVDKINETPPLVSPLLPLNAPAGSTLEWRLPQPTEQWWWENAKLWTTMDTGNPHWVLVPPEPKADPEPATGQVWEGNGCDRSVKVLIVAAEYGKCFWVDISDFRPSTEKRYTAMSDWLRDFGFHYIGEAKITIK